MKHPGKEPSILTAIVIMFLCLGVPLILGGCEHNGPASEQTPDPTAQHSEPAVSTEDLISLDTQPYYDVNSGQPYFTELDLTTEPFETYSELDNLGRCSAAYANICQELMPTGPRGEIGMVKPSGWQTVRYDDLVDGKYLYNRCHLIGFQLAGENANEKNLITGTRYMNVTGMLPFENRVADYVEETGNHVLYRVTPIFKDNELVARGVLMEAQSVEDAGLVFCVYCPNIQPGIAIDYATGESWRNESYTPPAATAYILNTNTQKFHLPTCASVADMAEKNKQESLENREQLIRAGYTACGVCKP